jgi:hypothetical protein
MKSRRTWKTRTIGALMACCMIVVPWTFMTMPGCGGPPGALRLHDWQRDLLLAAGTLALWLLGGGAADDGPGQAIPAGCTIDDNEDGTSTITCIQVNEDGTTTSTTVTVNRGEFTGCTVEDVEDGAQITCDDGTSVTVRDGQDGAPGGGGCSVTDSPDGSATITCDDGTSATIPPGQDGQDGQDGEDGQDGTDGRDGRDGESCELEDSATELCIICGNDEVCITKNNGFPLFGTLFIDAFFTPTGGSFEAARSAGTLNPVEVFDPPLGCDVQTVAYKMGVPERYDLAGAGNPITMRLFIYRTGPSDGECMVLRLDAYRAMRDDRIMTYGATRYINLDLSGLTEIDDELEGLLVVDLPLNNGMDLTRSLGFPTPSKADLLAFELNTLEGDRLNDGGCYSLLGVDFFESHAGDPDVMIDGATVTESAEEVDCGDCTLLQRFNVPDTDDVEAALNVTTPPTWWTSEADPDDVAIVGGMLLLRDDGHDPMNPVVQIEAQAVVFDVDVSGPAAPKLVFQWGSLGANSAFDRLLVQWRLCSDETTILTNSYPDEQAFIGTFKKPPLRSLSLQTGPQFPATEIVEVELPPAALAEGCVDLRFVTLVSDDGEGALIDFIELCEAPGQAE